MPRRPHPSRSKPPYAAPSTTWSPPTRFSIPSTRPTSPPKSPRRCGACWSIAAITCAPASCWWSSKAATWPLPPTKARTSTSRRRRPIRPSPGATVQEDQTKARSDVESARQALEAAKKVYESRVGAGEGGRASAKAGGRRQGRHGAGAKPVRYRPAPSGRARPGQPRNRPFVQPKPRWAPAKRIMKTPRAGFLRRRYAAPSPASWPIGRSIPGKCPPPARPWFPSWISRRSSPAPISR